LEASIRFGVDRGAVDAALRGLHVLVMGGRETVGDVVEAVEAHNRTSETRIDYSTLDVASE
jgi:predicted transcriptional regulator